MDTLHADMCTDWVRRLIVGTSMGTAHPPAWLNTAYRTFRDIVLDERYPCYFGSQAERRGALYYAFVSGGDLTSLPQTLHTFLDTCQTINQDRNNLVVFFEPDEHPPRHEDHHRRFWNVLRLLQAQDPCPAATPHRLLPSDPHWEFPFAGRELFVVGASPTYRQHRSRNLGAGMLMIFQPREVFGNEANDANRHVIRQRAQQWDGVPAHPDLNTFGQPGNREWAQYFISDDNSSVRGRCPLFDGHHAREGTEDLPAPPRDGSAEW